MRHQDWGIAALDFLIVVAGIFVALQVDSWNDRRIDRTYERQMKKNLHEEFSVTLQEGARMLSLIESARDSTGRIIDAIRNGAAPTDVGSFSQDIYRANWVFDSPTGSSTHSELLATGGISKLEDQSIRDALNLYINRSKYYEGNLKLAREITLSSESTYMQSVYWSTDARMWDDPASAIEGYDWEKLKAGHGEFQSWQAVQGNLTMMYSQVLEAAEQIVLLTKPAE